jgi:CLIP-associating protein 1/2
MDPVYGLSTMHSSLKKFLSEPVPSNGNPEARALSYAFGLLALGKFLLRLPPEILEEELPRLQLALCQVSNTFTRTHNYILTLYRALMIRSSWSESLQQQL